MMTDIMVTGRGGRGGEQALYEDGEVGEEVDERWERWSALFRRRCGATTKGSGLQ